MPDRVRDTRSRPLDDDGRREDMSCAGTPWGIRKQETARLAALVDSVAAGRSGVALVTGDAGLGKTSLLRAAVDRARAQGCRTLTATAQDYDHGIAFSTLKDLLASLEWETLDQADDDLRTIRQAVATDLLGGKPTTTCAPSDMRPRPTYSAAAVRPRHRLVTGRRRTR